MKDIKTTDKWGLTHYGRRDAYTGKEDKFQKGVKMLFDNIALFQTFNWYHVPNGDARPTKIIKGKRVSLVAIKLKDMGTKAGVSDMVLNYANNGYNGINIELKVATGGLKSEQKDYLLKDLDNGYYGCVVWSYAGLAACLNYYFGVDILSSDGLRILYSKRVLIKS